MNETNKTKQSVSVIVPIYNEYKNIPQLIARLSHSLTKTGMPYEIIFVDDRSTDGTRELLKKYADNKQIFVMGKQGTAGKAYSLFEGFAKARGTVIAMIDADLQYPPEEIPQMVKLLDNADVVVTDRKEYSGSFTRKIVSRSFRMLFGTFLFGLRHDIQSGLKVFKRQVIQTVKFLPSSGWTFDLEFLYRAKEAGFIIANHPITFHLRKNGNSKVGLVKNSWEIGSHALSLRLSRIAPQHIPPYHPGSMIGAGVGHKRKQYITHTILPHHTSAIQTLHAGQKVWMLLILSSVIAGIVINPLSTAIAVVAILSFIYFIDVLFNLYLILKSLHFPQEIVCRKEDIEAIDDSSLPVYSILCPLYREAHVIPQFLKAIEKIDWPKNKLDVMLLLEEDDGESVEAVNRMKLPSYVRSVIVPHSIPKTKPKACNYGLSNARGAYVVIYDAEDIPDPLQLKKAYLVFQHTPKEVLCLQAKLNYYNPGHNLLTRFFTAEYSLWFDLTLTGMQSINTSIPLGGTSNHFKTEALLRLHGWDPFNVTEDADLGIRLFKNGYKTAVIDSTTLEEANSNLKNWMRQRSRWLKGYMQTYFVHMRDILPFARSQGIHALIFQLVIGGKIAFILINPLLWIATVSYFALYAYVGPTIETLYPREVFYMAAFSLVFGNFLFLYYYMIGCVKREQYSLIKYIFLVPVYWLMISIACVMALYQLIFKPHYWEKTIHGFHLQKRVAKAIPQMAVEVIEEEDNAVFPLSVRERFAQRFAENRAYVSGAFLIGAMSGANVLNFAFNAYLGRVMDLANFGLLSLIGSFLYFTHIPYGALGSAVNYRTGFLEGRYGDETARHFTNWIRKKSLYISLAICSVWLALSPFLMHYFSVESILPFLLFAPVWVFGMIASVNRGFLAGKLMFGSLAIVALVEPIAKLATTYFFVERDLLPFVYAAIPISIIASYLVSASLAAIGKRNVKHEAHEVFHFPKKFFVSSLLSGLSTITFLSLDIVLANHYLAPEDAGRYALVSLTGKMIFFLVSLSSQFTTPLISHQEGARKNSENTFATILLTSTVLGIIGYLAFGFFGPVTAPLLFGERASAIVSYLPTFCLAMVYFSISRIFVTYYQAKNLYSFSVVTFMLALVQGILISMNHADISGIVWSMFITATLNLSLLVMLHLRVDWVRYFENNIADLYGLFFEKTPYKKADGAHTRILIYNWRDTKHVWAGGAELYIHEIAKRWVTEGNTVTVFCGNDGHSSRNETIDGVRIVRRGGSYTVYAWAFLYHLLRFRGKYDIIVDSENGIPFFTPLYARMPVLLLIHHVHQEVFREHLAFPFSVIARFLEAKVMPLVYRNNRVITVSESSKKEIVNLKLAKSADVEIVHPGIESEKFYVSKKTAYPSFLCLGRLKPYKNIDIAIKAFAKVAATHPEAQLAIIGEGEMLDTLRNLAVRLKIQDNVTFYGKISDQDKAILLSQSWVVVQPSQLEGWGITVIEANASGTPVIASNVAGLRDSILDDLTGTLVKPKNIDAFAAAMNDCIGDKLTRAAMLKAAYAWSHNFNWELSADKFLDTIMSDMETKYQYKTAGEYELAKENI